MGLNLDRLNPRQRAAVNHGVGPLLILAGAGSGKTSTMAYRIAHLISERSIDGKAILGLSFTNKAAKELKERVSHLVTKTSGRKATQGLTITTFHSLGTRVLRANASKLGFQENFTILDQNDQVDVLKQVLRNIRIDERRFDPELILFEIGQAKNRFLSPEQAETFFLESGRLSQDYALAAASSYGRYQEQLRILNALDFDDLIYYTVQLLSQHEDVRVHYNERFRHLLVDEYQDTNPAQFRILRLLTQSHQNLCVVGDDDQSIYSWRGADPTHILEFSKHYPSAETIILDQNYRSTSRILEAANSVISANRGRFPKKLWSDRGIGEPLVEVVVEQDRAEADFVAHEIMKRNRDQGRLWNDFAVLYRSNSQSRVFEEAFRRNGIPYKIVGGLSFLARKEVKDVLAYWKVIANTSDDASLRRIINWPSRGIGKTSLEALGSYSFQTKNPIFETLALNDPMLKAQLSAKASQAISGFRELILNLSKGLQELPATADAVASWGRTSLEKIQARKALDEDHDDPIQAAKKWENVEELVHSMGQFKIEEEKSCANGLDFLREFLRRMALEAQDLEKEKEESDKSEKNQVTLLTMHGAKGLEYPIVFLVGMEEGFLPHRRTIEEATDFGEERRLCYVGITRARDFLFLTRAKNRIRFGKPVPRTPSRFLGEIPKEMMVRIDESLVPDFNSEQAREQHETKVKNFLADIRARIGSKTP